MDLTAHRGASGLAPENTLAAFALSLQYEPEWIELDVHATSDGAIVVMHDKTVDRTTDGSGPIAGMTLAEIKRLDAGSWRGVECAGEPVPTLAEVARLVGDRSRLNIEIKGGPKLAHVAARVVEILAEAGILGQSLISSFDLEAVLAVRPITTAPALALITGNPDDLARAQEHKLDWLNLAHPGASAQLIAEAHASGIRVCAWTINDLGRWGEFRDMGVDNLCSDNCHLAPDRADR